MLLSAHGNQHGRRELRALTELFFDHYAVLNSVQSCPLLQSSYIGLREVYLPIQELSSRMYCGPSELLLSLLCCRSWTGCRSQSRPYP